MKEEIEQIILAHGRIVHQAGHDWFKEMAVQAAAEITRLWERDHAELEVCRRAWQRCGRQYDSLLAQLAEIGQTLQNIVKAVKLIKDGGSFSAFEESTFSAIIKEGNEALASAPEVLWAKAGKLWHEPYQVGDDTYIWAEYLEEVGSVRISGVKPGKHGQRVRVIIISAEEER